MNAFGGVRIAQDKSRNDGSKSNHEPGAFQEFYPFCDPREVPPQQSSMTDTASTATGDRSPAPECEASSHDAYGTPRKLFGEFFGVIADTMRDILGAERSPEIDAAWRKLLGEVDQVIAQVA